VAFMGGHIGASAIFHQRNLVQTYSPAAPLLFTGLKVSFDQ
jgi:hypothetical protein